MGPSYPLSFPLLLLVPSHQLRYVSLVLKILPIQSVNASDSSSPSIPQAILENVESNGMPFFSVRCFSSFSWFLFAHFTLRRHKVFPARNPMAMGNRISTWLCFRPHHGSGISLKYAANGLARKAALTNLQIDGNALGFPAVHPIQQSLKQKSVSMPFNGLSSFLH